MENKDSRLKVPLSVQIAMASVGNDIKHEKVKIEMIKDGFQLIWGIRKASEWVLDIKSEKNEQMDTAFTGFLGGIRWPASGPS